MFTPPTTPTALIPDDVFPFDHPAADRAHGLFMSLHVTSEEAYRALPLRERYLVDVKGFETDVMNGGIDQYMWNASGDHALECLEALKAIGATEAHSLLQNACELFPEHSPASKQEVRQKQLQLLMIDKSSLDELLNGGIEFELYELFLKFWDANEPKAQGL
jgi:hypothetical protein